MALFGQVQYWDDRYQETESTGPYDWYQSYPSIRHLLNIQALMAATKLDAISSFPTYDKCRVLILGCGNSTFGEDMIRDGWQGPIVNVDFSSVVVDQMKQKYCNNHFTTRYNCPSMEFVCADITKGLSFPDKSFDLIVCKGTFDAILCSAGSVGNAKTVVSECSRVLANGHGVLFLVSHGNPDSRVVFLEHESDISFYWKEVSFHTVGRKNKGGGNKHDYVYICRKRLEDVSRGDHHKEYHAVSIQAKENRSLEQSSVSETANKVSKD